MHDAAELLDSLAKVAAETDRLRSQASAALREAVGDAADRGLTQKQIGEAIGRSQPEVSRLVSAHRANRFRPTSPLGRLLVRHRARIVDLAREHNVSNIRVFGSVARGEDDAGSDIDLLVDLEPGADLIDLATLEVELERMLGHPVDIVPARILKPDVAASAIADAIEL